LCPLKNKLKLHWTYLLLASVWSFQDTSSSRRLGRTF
jgi:hypothetical protein